MAQNVKTAHTELRWYGPAVQGEITSQMASRLRAAADYLRERCRANLSSSSPSQAGSFPGTSTGALRDSIFTVVDPAELSIRLGTSLAYGYYLEVGTAGGRTLTAAPGHAFSWIDPQTHQRVFAKTIHLGPVRARSFLRRTMMEEGPAIEAILGSPGKGGASGP